MVIAARIEADLIKRIQNTRRELLDLSARNRLISTPRGSSRGRKIEIVDERSEEVFRLLVRERKAMSFLPGAEQSETDTVVEADSPLLAQPEDEVGGRRDARPPPRRSPLADPSDLGTTPGSAPLHLLRRPDLRAGAGRQHPLPGDGLPQVVRVPVLRQGPVRAAPADPGGPRAPDGRQPVPPAVPRRGHHDEPLAPGEAEGRVRHRPARRPRDGRDLARGVLRRRRPGPRRPAALGGLAERHGRLVLLVREVPDVPRPRPGHLAGALAPGQQPDAVQPPGRRVRLRAPVLRGGRQDRRPDPARRTWSTSPTPTVRRRS